MDSVHELKANIPAFLAKLWNMVDDESTDKIIRWNRKGSGFIIGNQASFSYQLLPVYYKHNNMSSFVRQLNMYGFHKTTTLEAGSATPLGGDEVQFVHPCFQKDDPQLLKLIRRKTTVTTKVTDGLNETGEEFIQVLSDVRVLKHKQKSVDEQLSAVKEENTILWRELAILRQKHEKQQQIVNKLIQFLVTIVRPPAHMGGLGVKRQYPLMLKQRERPAKRTKPNNSSTPDGPTIHELDIDVGLPSKPDDVPNVEPDALYDIFSPDKLDESDDGVLLNPVAEDVLLSDLMNGSYSAKHSAGEDMRVAKRDKQRSLSRLNSVEDFGSLVETTQNELDQLKDVLHGCTAFDASALFGLFTDESISYGLGSIGDDGDVNPLGPGSELTTYESGLSQLLGQSVDEDVNDTGSGSAPGGPMLSADGLKRN